MSLINAEMIAPCGLNCALCKRALQRDTPCQGCRGPYEVKSRYCKEICHIWTCDKLMQNQWRYCDACPEYPCEEIIEKETRYGSQYPVKESPMDNLKNIRKMGMESFLASEHEKWMCPKCGGIICVHTARCSDCDEDIS